MRPLMFDNIVGFDCFHVIRIASFLWDAVYFFFINKITRKGLWFCEAFVYAFPVTTWLMGRRWLRFVSVTWARQRYRSDNVGQQHLLPTATSLYSATLPSFSAIDSGELIVQCSTSDQRLQLHCASVQWVVLAGERDAWWGGTEEENRPVVALNQHPQLLRYRNNSPIHRRRAHIIIIIIYIQYMQCLRPV